MNRHNGAFVLPAMSMCHIRMTFLISGLAMVPHHPVFHICAAIYAVLEIHSFFSIGSNEFSIFYGNQRKPLNTHWSKAILTFQYKTFLPIFAYSC